MQGVGPPAYARTRQWPTYTPGQKLGSGGMGSVYYVFDQASNEFRVVKVNNVKLSKELKGFFNALNGSSMQKYFTITTASEFERCITNPCVGYNLFWFLKTKACIVYDDHKGYCTADPKLFHMVCKCLLDVIDFAWSNDLSFCDLKLENMMVCKDDKRGVATIKVIDIDDMVNADEYCKVRTPTYSYTNEPGWVNDYAAFCCILMNLLYFWNRAHVDHDEWEPLDTMSTRIAPNILRFIESCVFDGSYDIRQASEHYADLRSDDGSRKRNPTPRFRKLIDNIINYYKQENVTGIQLFTIGLFHEFVELRRQKQTTSSQHPPSSSSTLGPIREAWPAADSQAAKKSFSHGSGSFFDATSLKHGGAGNDGLIRRRKSKNKQAANTRRCHV